MLLFHHFRRLFQKPIRSWLVTTSLIWIPIVSIIVSALIAPALYQLFRESLGRWPYSRVFDRVIAVVLIIVILLVRKWGLFATTSRLLPPASLETLRSILLGYLISAVPALVMILVLLSTGEVGWKYQDSLLVLFLVKALPAALGVSFIEELLFRGVIFLALRQRFSFWSSAVVSSLLYASVHFIVPQRGWSFTSWSLSTGFEYLGVLIHGFAHPGIAIGIGALCCVGFLLAFAFERSGNLALSFGLHAGWITSIKFIAHGVVFFDALDAIPRALGRRYLILTHSEFYVAILASALLLLTLLSIRKRSA